MVISSNFTVTIRAYPDLPWVNTTVITSIKISTNRNIKVAFLRTLDKSLGFEIILMPFQKKLQFCNTWML